MLDARFVRENIDVVKRVLENRNMVLPLDDFLQFEEQRRSILKEAEELRNKRNVVSEEIGRLKSRKQDASNLIVEMKDVSDRIRVLDENIKALEEKTNDFLLNVPNIPDESVPVGKDETENVEIRKWGQIPEFSFSHLTFSLSSSQKPFSLIYSSV